MKFIFKHKLTLFAILIFVITVILVFFASRIFFINSSNPEYGNRLNGIENVKITTENLKAMETTIKKNENVTNVTSNIIGKTLDVVITIKNNVSLKTAKEIAAKSYADLNEKQILYYSIQIFIKKEDTAQNNFPIIGYKQKNTKSLVWTRDRKVVDTDESK